MLSFYPQFWTQAFDFEGRTSRIDYWKIVLVNLIIGGVLSKVSPWLFIWCLPSPPSARAWR